MITPECSLLIYNSLCSGLVDFIYCVSSPEVIVLQLAPPGGGVLTMVFPRIMCSNRRVNSMLDAGKQVVFRTMDASKKKVFLKCVWQMSVISKPARHEKIISALSSHRRNPLAWTPPPPPSPTKPHILPCTTRTNHNLSPGKKKKKDLRLCCLSGPRGPTRLAKSQQMRASSIAAYNSIASHRWWLVYWGSSLIPTLQETEFLYLPPNSPIETCLKSSSDTPARLPSCIFHASRFPYCISTSAEVTISFLRGLWGSRKAF